MLWTNGHTTLNIHRINVDSTCFKNIRTLNQHWFNAALSKLSDTQLVIKLSFGRFLIKVSYVLPDATVTFTTEIQLSLIFHVGDNTDWLYFFLFFLSIYFKCKFSFNIRLLGNKCHLGKESPLHCIGAKKSLLKALVNILIPILTILTRQRFFLS